jgi:hypothetical protein
METDRKIIIAVDDSETSAYAFTWALHHLLKKSDKVIVLTAARFVTLDFPSTDIASGTYTYIHTCASFFGTLMISSDFYCSCSILLLGIDLYIVLLMSSSFSFLFVCVGVWRRGYFFSFLPSLCVEPASRSSLPKCSIA